MFIRYFIFITICIIVSGCLSTQGEIEISGKTIDKVTKEVVPSRKVIVEALLYYNQNQSRRVNVGQFYSDSLGCFSFKLNKIKGAYDYDFKFVGDSAYASSTQGLGIGEISKNSKYLIFYLDKLSKLTIKIARSNNSHSESTLYLSWKSDGIEGKTLYPYKLSNFGSAPDFDFKWSHNNVSSKIETRVFADKPTIISWEIRNGNKKQEIIDTLICKRDITNYINFTY